MSRHSSPSGASAPDSSDDVQTATSESRAEAVPRGLTRRELRELEREGTEVAEAAVAANSDVHFETVDAAAIAAPLVDQPGTPDVDLLLTPGKTSTTSIPLPTRAQLRADENTARRPRRVRPEAAVTGGAATYAPSRPFVPAGVTPRMSPRARPANTRMRRLAAQGTTVGAMAFVLLMAISTSVPAQALLSTADVQASALAAQRPASAEGVQTLDVTGHDTITVQRDGYESSTIAEVAQASGIRMEATFTNNPNGTIQWPFAVGVHIGDHIGPRNCAGCSANHGGQDFNPGLGAPIQSIADGVVKVAEDGEASLGVHMIIDHMVDGKLVSSVYAHMIHGSMNFKTGDVVKVGQVIGKTGSTGMSTGPHLHFEIREGGIDGTKVDPLAWLYANTN